MAAGASATRTRSVPRRRKTGRAPSEVDWRLVWGAASIGAILLGVVAELAVLVPSGLVGEPTRWVLTRCVGWTAPLLPLWPVALGLLGFLKTLRPELRVPNARIWSAALAHLALIGLSQVFLAGGPGAREQALEGKGGGLVGFALGTGLSEALGPVAATLLLLAGLALGVMLAFDVTLSRASFWFVKSTVAGVRALHARGARAVRSN